MCAFCGLDIAKDDRMGLGWARQRESWHGAGRWLLKLDGKEILGAKLAGVCVCVCVHAVCHMIMCT